MKPTTSSPYPSPASSAVVKPPRLTRFTHNFSRVAEKVSSLSQTIPDDSFTILELFNRHRSGAPLPIGLDRSVTYSDSPTHADPDYSSVQRMDLTEVSQMRLRASQYMETLKAREAQIKAEKRDDSNDANKGPEKPSNEPK